VDDIEHLLKQYRPVGPPADFRARVTAAGGADGRTRRRGWLGVAAMLLCAALFYTLAAREHERIAMRLPLPMSDVSPEPGVEPWP
jgi:hypothetical protein